MLRPHEGLIKIIIILLLSPNNKLPPPRNVQITLRSQNIIRRGLRESESVIYFLHDNTFHRYSPSRNPNPTGSHGSCCCDRRTRIGAYAEAARSSLQEDREDSCASRPRAAEVRTIRTRHEAAARECGESQDSLQVEQVIRK